jgi:hypothetical protein
VVIVKRVSARTLADGVVLTLSDVVPGSGSHAL